MTPDHAAQRQATAANCSAELLRELQYAHQIIQNALNLMTIGQKLDWCKANTRDGVDGDGITRYYERETVIARATRGLETPSALISTLALAPLHRRC